MNLGRFRVEQWVKIFHLLQAGIPGPGFEADQFQQMPVNLHRPADPRYLQKGNTKTALMDKRTSQICSLDSSPGQGFAVGWKVQGFIKITR